MPKVKFEYSCMNILLSFTTPFLRIYHNGTKYKEIIHEEISDYYVIGSSPPVLHIL